MARRTHVAGRFLHRAGNPQQAIGDARAAGRISDEEQSALEKLVLRSLRGEQLTPLDLKEISRLTVKVTGDYPPVGALVAGNRKAFVAPDLHDLYILDTAGMTPRPWPREWLLKLVNDEAEGVSSMRSAYGARLRAVLATYFGPDYARIIRETVRTRRVREVLSSEVMEPNFSLPRPGWRHARDPEAMMRELLTLDDRAGAHFLKGVHATIGAHLRALIQQVGPRELAERIMQRRVPRRILLSSAYISHAKGWIFERLLEPEQFRMLRELRASMKSARARRGTVLVRGVLVRLRRADGTLGPPVAFSDGVLVTFTANRRGRPGLHFHDVHEAKSGVSGDVSALQQTDKWTLNLSDIGEVIIPADALVTRVRLFDRTETTDFGSFLARIGERSAERRLRRTEVVKRGKAMVSRTSWVFAANLELAPLAVRRRRPPTAMVEAPKDTIFLANSRQAHSPDAEDLRSFFPSQVVPPLIVPHLVAEEIEYLAVKLLEEVAESIFSRRTAAAGGGYWELTPQRLKAK